MDQSQAVLLSHGSACRDSAPQHRTIFPTACRMLPGRLLGNETFALGGAGHREPRIEEKTTAVGLLSSLPLGGLPCLSRSSVLHQRRNLHELDAGPYAVETRYALQKRIGEKVFGCVL